MCSHSHQKTLGNTFRHVKLYNREEELYNLYPEIDFNSKNIDNLLPLNNNYKEHYISIYNARNREIKQFFSHLDPTRLVTVDLEDPLKWKKLGDYFNFTVADGYNVHKNKSQK